MPSYLGQFVRSFARSLVRCYYREIEVTDAKYIAGQGSVLICANHPNSLLDPIVVGTAAQRPVRFFAKAPLFQKPILGPVMKALGMIPAYRGMDDSRQVRRNLESLDRGIEALQEGSAVGIFPEGKSHDDVGVEMVRSGAARMALRAFTQGATDLQVVPLGLNYERKERFRTVVWVRVGEPILMQDWYAQHHVEGESDRQTLRRFTHELQTRLQHVTIHLEDQQWQEWLADLEHLAPQIPLSEPTRVPKLRRRKQIADAMNYFLNQDSERALAVADQIRTYRSQARQIGLTPASQVLHGNRLVAWGQWLLHLAGMTITAIPAALGLVFHILPFWLSRHGARLFTPPGRTAVSLYRLLVGFPVFLVWYLLTLLLLLKYLPPVSAVVSWLILPWLGILAYHYWASAPRIWRDLWQQFRSLISPQRVAHLLQTRQELRQQLEQLAEDYRNRP